MSEDSREREFVQLIEEHSGIIFKVTRIYAANKDDEQDLRQEVIYQAWRSFNTFSGKSKFSTWLYRVALNTALTHQRKKELPKSEGFDSDWSISPEGDERTRLMRHIRGLKDAEKLIIMLHLDGYTNEEVAMISGLTKNHLAVKLHRVKEKLAQSIKEEENGN